MGQLIKAISPKELDSIDVSNIKGILIDIDDTLYSYKDAHKAALIDCYTAFTILPKTHKKLTKILEISLNDFQTLYLVNRQAVYASLTPQCSCRSRLLAFKNLFEELVDVSDQNLSYQLALQFENIYWNSLIENIKPNNEVASFLEKKFLDGLKICAVSDMQTSIQIRKILKLNLHKFIPYLVTSEEAGIEKPHSKIFDLALSKIKLPPSKVIMIGDSYLKDYEGATQLGIQSFLIDLNAD
jgi:FMN phosphatase YigB (HAD superfamily)